MTTNSVLDAAPDNQKRWRNLENTIAEFGMKLHFPAEFGVHLFYEALSLSKAFV